MISNDGLIGHRFVFFLHVNLLLHRMHSISVSRIGSARCKTDRHISLEMNSRNRFCYDDRLREEFRRHKNEAKDQWPCGGDNMTIVTIDRFKMEIHSFLPDWVCVCVS